MRQIRAGGQLGFFAAGIERAIAPGDFEVGEAHASAAARASAAQRVVFQQAQAFDHARRQRLILFAQNVQHHADAETRARRNALQRTRIGLRGDAVDGVLALDLGDLVVQILAHLRGDALLIERRVVDGQPRGTGRLGLQRLAFHALHAARIAAEQQADFVVGTVALMDAHLLAAALRKIHQLGRRR